MTKSKIAELFKKFDDEKLSTFEQGTDFKLILHDQAHDSYIHTGIGTAESMSKMTLYSLLSLYKAAGKQNPAAKLVPIEEYAESIKELVIKAWKENIFDIESIDGSDGDKG